MSLSPHGFITRCKLKTKEERNDTTEFISPESLYLRFLYSTTLADEPTQDHNNTTVNFSFSPSIAGLFTISWIVRDVFCVSSQD